MKTKKRSLHSQSRLPSRRDRAHGAVKTNVPDVVPAQAVTVEQIKIHGTALEASRGDAVDRDVIVFLPPSYSKDKHRRYPVVYALHGYSIGADSGVTRFMCRRQSKARLQKAAGDDRRPADSKTSTTAHVFEFRDHGRLRAFHFAHVVEYIDAHYRTIPERTSRGLVGHSMGGYGASASE